MTQPAPNDDEDDAQLDDDFDIVQDGISALGLQSTPSDRVKSGGQQEPIVDDELARFRAQWKQEVEAKKHQHEVEVDHGPVRWKQETPAASKSALKEPEAKVRSPKKPITKPISPSTATSPLSPARVTAGLGDPGPSTAGPSKSPERATRTLKPPAHEKTGKAKIEEATSIYSEAVEAEQTGRLNDALKLYRQAFKLDDNVDRVYALHRRKEIEREVAEAKDNTPTSTDVVSSSAPSTEPYSFQRHIQTAPDYDASHAPPSGTSQLTAIFNSASVDASHADFEPAEEELPLPISRLPNEIFEHIFARLDVTSLEAFGSTCWKARYLTCVSERWRILAHRIYVPPAIVRPDVKPRDLVAKYGGEWRTMVVQEDRLRMDGCYIAVCHYIRPGAGDEWVAITHMITYHRFLRFYPDGTVISFLTTDHPSETVPLLRQSLRAKGLHIGRYTLHRPTPDPEHPTKKPHARVTITDLLEPGINEPKYEFEMELSLRETGRGRWNKLDILEYRSINLATGEALALALKHQKPFYFSKVRSYQPAF